MRRPISKFQTFFTTAYGHCRTCMRISLVAALTAWAVFGLGYLLWPASLVQTLTGILALGLTAHWTLHIAAYAARAMVRGRTRTGYSLPPIAEISVPAYPGAVHIGRRAAIGVLLRAAGVGMAASVPALVWSSPAFAFCGQCTISDDCGVGFECKNTAAVNSGEVCNECVKS